MGTNLKDIVYSNTYGSDPWLMQFHKVLFIANDLYSHGKESAYNTKSHEARVKYWIVIGKRSKMLYFWGQFCLATPYIIKVAITFLRKPSSD